MLVRLDVLETNLCFDGASSLFSTEGLPISRRACLGIYVLVSVLFSGILWTKDYESAGLSCALQLGILYLLEMSFRCSPLRVIT